VTLLITGGAGFIGSNLVYHALEHTVDRLVIVDKLTYAGSLLTLGEALTDSRVTFIEADIADHEAMTAVFADVRPAAVLNLAAETHVDRSIDTPRPFIDTNIVGVRAPRDRSNVCRRLPSSVRDGFRFLHVSTDEVYGTLGRPAGSARKRLTRRTRRMRPARRPPIIWCGPYFHTFQLPVLMTNCSNSYVRGSFRRS
jgi:dTDP-glucose 4,6-dehydratase